MPSQQELDAIFDDLEGIMKGYSPPFAVKPPSKALETKRSFELTSYKKVTIAGNLCETGDVFGKERLMPIPKSGDIIAVLHTGAYCRSMASNFNLRQIPREILI